MRKVFKLDELDCAVCGEKMQNATKKVNGVNDCVVSFMTQKMTIDFADDANIETIMDEVIKVCKKIEPDCKIVK